MQVSVIPDTLGGLVIDAVQAGGMKPENAARTAYLWSRAQPLCGLSERAFITALSSGRLGLFVRVHL
jgi:hypothetical protein